MNPTIKVAQQFPNVMFDHATGYKTAKNVGVYNARFYEGPLLCGIIAGTDDENERRRLRRGISDSRSRPGNQSRSRGDAQRQSQGRGESDLDQLRGPIRVASAKRRTR